MLQLARQSVRELPLATVDGWPINIATLDSAVSQIADAAEQAESFSVVTINLDHLVKLRRDAEFRKAYKAARFFTADGAPIARFARRQCGQIERTTGADLLVPLCREAAARKIGVYLFGTSNEVLGRAGVKLLEHTEYDLTICGTASPSSDFDPTGPEADAALDAIAASGAHLVFVALGAPKQEVFAARAVERGIKAGFICVGAALDFITGRQVRAPNFLKNNGLEWFWRLSLNPARLAPRYARCAWMLMELELVEPLRGSPTPLRRS